MTTENSPVKPVSVVLTGICGYGQYYLETLLKEFPGKTVLLEGAVDPYFQKSPLLPEMKRRGIPVFTSLDDFYHSGRRPGLAVICSPPHWHVPHSSVALRNGSHVLCEKPLAITIQDAEDLIRTRDETDRFVMIGYQWSYSPAMEELKSDIIKGVLGRPLRARTLCLWPRRLDYYERNDWAGKMRLPDGRWILDSPASNAMAHFLHLLFFLLGSGVGESARPVEITAESYRAYPIENFDTVACRAETGSGVELLFYASHAVSRNQGPMFGIEFEEGVVTFGDPEREIVARYKNGPEKRYGSPEASHPFQKLFTAVRAVRRPSPVQCGPEAALAQTLCVNGIQESVPEISDFPASLIRRAEGGRRRWVANLVSVLMQCYSHYKLPSETGVEWSRCGAAVDLRHYNFFPGAKVS